MGSGKWNTEIGYFCYFYLQIYPVFKECGKYSGSPLQLNLAFIANFDTLLSYWKHFQQMSFQPGICAIFSMANLLQYGKHAFIRET